MFEKLSNLIEGRLAGPLEKLSNQRHLRAIRDGIIATLPLIIVSSLLMVIAFSYNQMPESWAIRQVIQNNETQDMKTFGYNIVVDSSIKNQTNQFTFTESRVINAIRLKFGTIRIYAEDYYYNGQLIMTECYIL